jgi:hypothetical protein
MSVTAEQKSSGGSAVTNTDDDQLGVVLPGCEDEVLCRFVATKILVDLMVDAGTLEPLRKAYTDTEIVGLAATVAFSMGFGRVNAVLDIANDCAVRID